MWFRQPSAFWLGVLSILFLSLLLLLSTVCIIQSILKGKWKKVILITQKTVIFIGIIIMVVGIVARIVHEDFHVWYSILMAGLMLVSILLPQYFYLAHYYAMKDKLDHVLNNEQKTNEVLAPESEASTDQASKDQGSHIQPYEENTGSIYSNLTKKNK